MCGLLNGFVWFQKKKKPENDSVSRSFREKGAWLSLTILKHFLWSIKSCRLLSFTKCLASRLFWQHFEQEPGQTEPPGMAEPALPAGSEDARQHNQAEGSSVAWQRHMVPCTLPWWRTLTPYGQHLVQTPLPEVLPRLSCASHCRRRYCTLLTAYWLLCTSCYRFQTPWG